MPKHPKPIAAAPADLCSDGTLAHYWRLDPQNGPTSWGRCRKCKARREFRNYWEPPTEPLPNGHKKMPQMSLHPHYPGDA